MPVAKGDRHETESLLVGYWYRGRWRLDGRIRPVDRAYRSWCRWKEAARRLHHYSVKDRLY